MSLKLLLLLFVLLCAGDAATTHIILLHGGREIIFPTQSPWTIDGLVVGQAALAAYVCSKVDKQYPKETRIVAGVLIALRAFAVVHNALIVHKILQ